MISFLNYIRCQVKLPETKVITSDSLFCGTSSSRHQSYSTYNDIKQRTATDTYIWEATLLPKKKQINILVRRNYKSGVKAKTNESRPHLCCHSQMFCACSAVLRLCPILAAESPNACKFLSTTPPFPTPRSVLAQPWSKTQLRIIILEGFFCSAFVWSGNITQRYSCCLVQTSSEFLRQQHFCQCFN